MAANINPIFSLLGDVQWICNCTAANTTIDLTSGTSYLVFTADGTNGGYIREVRCKANPSQNTAATVLRIWINTGAAISDTNTFMFDDIGIPATTASNTNPTQTIVMPMNIVLPPGYKIYASFGTAPGGSGEFMVAAIGGKY